ncbi:enoyl-CoA hydratase/isomerase family protein (plasmid) [Burkholderia gladioli]|nr:enoyl-CoA hydratase/isomerase family protein [Burkholderia gladioli]
MLANRIYIACRRIRRDFLTIHTTWLYNKLTLHKTCYLRIAELAALAARKFPGLLPSEERMHVENSLPQSHKEGLEIDQAIFFRELLRVPDVGSHLISAMQRPTSFALALNEEFDRTGRADLGSVQVERISSAAHLTIYNPHCLNAEDNELTRNMETAIDLILMNNDVKVGVIRGGYMNHPKFAGQRVFSAGINLKNLSAGKISFVEFLLQRELGYINKIFRGLVVERSLEGGVSNITEIEKPWVGIIDNFAIGGGAQLLLVLDRVLAATNSFISLPAANEGIIPGFANLRLGRMVGQRMARQMVLGGRIIQAVEPDARYLIDEIFDAQDPDASIKRNVDSLCNPAVIANRRLLHLAEEPLEEFRRYAAEFALLQATRLYSTDVLNNLQRQEAVRAVMGAR